MHHIGELTRGIRIFALVFIGSSLAARQPQQPPASTPPILENYKPLTAERLKAPKDGEWLMVRHTYHDPLFRFHQGEANLRVLNVTEIKAVPELPWSHPFIERLIGTIRRECLDRSLFWTATDLELKLGSFRDYYNETRTHSALKAKTPVENPGSKGARLQRYRWRTHCLGLYQTPIAA